MGHAAAPRRLRRQRPHHGPADERPGRGSVPQDLAGLLLGWRGIWDSSCRTVEADASRSTSYTNLPTRLHHAGLAVLRASATPRASDLARPMAVPGRPRGAARAPAPALPMRRLLRIRTCSPAPTPPVRARSEREPASPGTTGAAMQATSHTNLLHDHRRRWSPRQCVAPPRACDPAPVGRGEGLRIGSRRSRHPGAPAEPRRNRWHMAVGGRGAEGRPVACGWQWPAERRDVELHSAGVGPWTVASPAGEIRRTISNEHRPRGWRGRAPVRLLNGLRKTAGSGTANYAAAVTARVGAPRPSGGTR